MWAALALLAVVVEAPHQAKQFEPAEFVVHVEKPSFDNPFTDAWLGGEFTSPDGRKYHATGFCDSEDGAVFRLRFAPPSAGRYRFKLNGLGQGKAGDLEVAPATGLGPVVVDPAYPKHFRHAGSGKHFYHLGYTAYHLLDPSRTDAQIDQTIEYCVRMGFNKIRFLLAGYPRDMGLRTSTDAEHGVPDPTKAPNYGAPPGRPQSLPAWQGQPHHYDFTRFHLPHWRRVDRAILKMRARGVVAMCIFTIEKQDLPQEYGRLTADELRFYEYAVARLGAYDNVWWDLGNEHNEYRDKAWGDAMGSMVRALDPHDRLRSAHAYADFWYADSKWPGFIITQQYGDERTVHDWAHKYAGVPLPYVNEEYGYEGAFDRPGHGQNTDWVRRTHWAIAVAGGYASYGDWSNGVAYFYTGDPGPGRAPAQLKHLRAFFEAIPYWRMRPEEAPGEDVLRLGDGSTAVVFFPHGGSAQLELQGEARWFDPRSGAWGTGPRLGAGVSTVTAPTAQDWVLLIRQAGAEAVARPGGHSTRTPASNLRPR